MKKTKISFDTIKAKVKALDKKATRQLKGGFVIGALDVDSA